MVVVAPADLKFARNNAVPLPAIVHEHFIMREKGSGTRIAVEQKFAISRKPVSTSWKWSPAECCSLELKPIICLALAAVCDQYQYMPMNHS